MLIFEILPHFIRELTSLRTLFYNSMTELPFTS